MANAQPFSPGGMSISRRTRSRTPATRTRPSVCHDDAGHDDAVNACVLRDVGLSPTFPYDHDDLTAGAKDGDDAKQMKVALKKLQVSRGSREPSYQTRDEEQR
eukprot:4130047-Amphidinium_carterae.4